MTAKMNNEDVDDGGNDRDMLSPSDPNFSFPFQPYSIQKDLMKHLYKTLVQKQITVIESPTGTGKSLSLISSSLTFLHDLHLQKRHELIQSIRKSVQSDPEHENEPHWVLKHEIETRLKAFERDEKELEERLKGIRQKEREEREREKKEEMNGLKGGNRRKRPLDNSQRVDQSSSNSTSLSSRDSLEDEFAPEPYIETEQDLHKVDENGPDNFSPAVRAMLAKMSSKSKNDGEEEPDVSKIYFASRTHSQLTQFIQELRKTPFSQTVEITSSASDSSSSGPSKNASSSSSQQRVPIRVIPLGSRTNLCINDEVRKKSNGNNEMMGDLCLELQKNNTSGGSGHEKGKGKRCELLPPLDEPGKLNEFRDKALASVNDIEDIEDLGRRTKTCPYYGSRKAVRSAQLVTLPYNMLMSKSAREALGIQLKDHIVIIDEAHNLIDSILQLHSVSISLTQITSIRGALLTYLAKFKNRLNGANANYLRQLALVLKNLSEFVNAWVQNNSSLSSTTGKRKEEMISVNAIIIGKGSKSSGMDQINLYKLNQYLKQSRIARKIGGYVDFLNEETNINSSTSSSNKQAIKSNATKNMQKIQEFVVSLASSEKDGRILLTAEPKSVPSGQSGDKSSQPIRYDITLKYMLLAPSESFREIAEEARSVVLAGGTMAPMSDFKEQLFPYIPKDRFSTFSCGHVVPSDHIAAFAISKGPSNQLFEFKFEQRKNEKLLDELGQTIINLSNIIPKGIVVFVPSYDFLFSIQTRWEKTGVVKKLGLKKKVFWEPKLTSEVDMILREYSACINSPLPSASFTSSSSSPSSATTMMTSNITGAILFAVVGAKLSEGINFADDMARAVIICGIPYPNAHSTELKERMNYLKSTAVVKGVNGPDPGQVLYQNLAFRAVNQSIGRAIRNARDWAAIILLDARYQQPSKQAQLPGWLGSNVKNIDGFGQLMKEVIGFVKRRRAAQAEEAGG